MKLGIALLVAFALAGCQPPANLAPPSGGDLVEVGIASPSPVHASSTPDLQPDLYSTDTEIRVDPIPTSTPLPTGVPFEMCSPLEDLDLAELADIVSNPFQQPRVGLDDGHHGVDFAYYTRGDRKTMLGLPVHALLAGRVAASVIDRPPYGNMVIVETPLDQLPDPFLKVISPTPQPTADPANIRLTCPTPEVPPAWSTDRSSVYILYAHLNQPPLVKIGDTVSCGLVIGEVGTTGASVNPHLHLELRWGPADAEFPTMAHYEIQASDEERSNYCAWRVSGVFQMVDPMEIIETWGK